MKDKLMDKFCPYSTADKAYKFSKYALVKRLLLEKDSWINLIPVSIYNSLIDSISLPFANICIISDPTLIKKILVDEPEKFPKHNLLHFILLEVLGVSIFTTNGEIWHKQREIIDQGFVSDNIKNAFFMMLAASNSLNERISHKTNTYFEIDSEMTYVTADIIFRAIMSDSIEANKALEIYDNFIAYQNVAQRMLLMKMCKLPTFYYRRKARKYAKIIRQALIASIDKRITLIKRGENTPDDILSILINSSDKKGNRFPREELIDQICMLFLAGHETSAAALAWTLYLIARDKQVQEKIHTQIETICPEGITVDNFRKLTYINDVFRESLRLFPPVSMILREPVEDIVLNNIKIKKNSLIIISPWIVQRNKMLWNNPDYFDPDNFSKEGQCKAALNAYLPFSKGQRTCPGAGFALQEAILVIATLVKNFTIEADPNHTPIPVDKATLRAKNGVRLKFTKRDNNA